MKPESPVPGKQYVYGNRHEANTLEMVARKIEENPYEILTVFKQGRPLELQRLIGIGGERAKTVIRYWTRYSQGKA